MTAWFALLLVLQIDARRPTPAPRDEIVVVGERPHDDDERRLRACLDRGCPPADDVRFSLAVANQLFVAGNYNEARRTLRIARGRLGKAPAGVDPRLGASLWRAEAVVAEHQGDGLDAVKAAGDAARIMRKLGPEALASAVATQLQYARLQGRRGRLVEARHAFGLAGSLARQSGKPHLRAKVILHQAVFDWRTGKRTVADRELRELMATSDDALRSARVAAAALLIQLGGTIGGAGTDGLADFVRREARGPQPMLLFSPPLDLPTSTRADATVDAFQDRVRQVPTSAQNNGWIDIGYWVRSDGAVEDVEILRGVGRAGWAEHVARVIRQRRYASTEGVADEGTYKVQRFSLGHEKSAPLGSRIARRAGAGVVTEVELTRTTASPVAETPTS